MAPITRKQIDGLNEILKLDNPSNKDIISAIVAVQNNLTSKMDNLSDKVEFLFSENTKNQNQLTLFDQQLTNFKSVHEQFNTSQNSNTDRIVQLENESSKLKSESITLTNQINYFEQKELLNDVVISGFPVCAQLDNINASEILQLVLRAFNLVIDPENFIFCLKRTTKNSNKFFIIIRMNTNVVKKQLMNQAKAKKSLFLKEIWPNLQLDCADTNRIYINDRLTNFNFELLNDLRVLKKRGEIFASWYQEGRILIKSTKDSQILPINSATDISKLCRFNTEEPHTTI